MAAIEGAENLASVPDEEHALVFFALAFERAVGLEFFWTLGLEAAVIPGEFDFGHLAACGEFITDDRGLRIGLVVAVGGTGFDAGGGFEFQDTEDRVVAVGTHVAEGAASEVGPAAPTEGQVDMMERALRRGTKPEIPVEAFGDRLGFFRALQGLRPEGTARPIFHFAHGPDRSSPDPLAKLAGGFRCLIRDCNLRRDSGLAGDFGDAARFVDGVRERFLAENVFALLHR